MVDLAMKKLVKNFLLKMLYRLKHEEAVRTKVIEALEIIIDYL